jgi:hypothetical protein
MGKRSRAVVQDSDVPVVGLREPCPCGSGRRYKACHGRAAAAAPAVNARPFEGFASECDLVCMRELVPAATAPLRLVDDPERKVTLATVLPMAWPALVRSDGEIMLGMQLNASAGDPNAELGGALAAALQSESGEPIPPSRELAAGPPLSDFVDPAVELDISVHDNFDFWVDGDTTSDVQASLERASSFAHPTKRLTSVVAAYWTQMGAKEHVRWALPMPEDDVVNALARLHAAGDDSLGEGTRFVGMFRALGIVVPVWDLPLGTGADAIDASVNAFGLRFADAMAETTPLTDAQRRARAGLVNRQVTLR